MRWLGWTFPVLAAASALFISPASAIAATTSSGSISGYEYAATSAQGRFVGIASGALPGAWSVTVDHTPLGASAAITGGDFHLATYLAGRLAAVTGDFTGGTVTQLSGFTGCAASDMRCTVFWARWVLVQLAAAPVPWLPR